MVKCRSNGFVDSWASSRLVYTTPRTKINDDSGNNNNNNKNNKIIKIIIRRNNNNQNRSDKSLQLYQPTVKFGINFIGDTVSTYLYKYS